MGRDQWCLQCKRWVRPISSDRLTMFLIGMTVAGLTFFFLPMPIPMDRFLWAFLVGGVSMIVLGLLMGVAAICPLCKAGQLSEQGPPVV